MNDIKVVAFLQTGNWIACNFCDRKCEMKFNTSSWYHTDKTTQWTEWALGVFNVRGSTWCIWWRKTILFWESIFVYRKIIMWLITLKAYISHCLAYYLTMKLYHFCTLHARLLPLLCKCPNLHSYLTMIIQRLIQEEDSARKQISC